MKITKLFIIPAMLFTSLVANAADMQPVAKPDPAIAQMRPIDKLKQELALTDEQVKSIEEIQQQNRKTAIEERKAAADGEFKNFFDLAPDSKEYEETVKKMADAAATRTRKNVVNMAESRKKVYDILNAEQKKKFLTLTKPKQRQVIRQERKGEKPAVE